MSLEVMNYFQYTIKIENSFITNDLTEGGCILRILSAISLPNSQTVVYHHHRAGFQFALVFDNELKVFKPVRNISCCVRRTTKVLTSQRLEIIIL